MFIRLITELGLTDHFVVDSAGTGGWHVGHPADKRMQAAANRRGIQLPSRARQIEPQDLSSFDHILTMDEDNLRDVISLAKEFGQKSTANIRPMLSHARNVDKLDVPDPYYGGDHGFDHVLDLLEDACQGLLEDLLDPSGHHKLISSQG